MQIGIQDILEYLKLNGEQIRYVGSQDILVCMFYSLDKLQSNGLTWIRKVRDDKIYDFSGLENCIIVADKAVQCDNIGVGFIITSNPRNTFFSILNAFFTSEEKGSIIGENTVIGEQVVVGENVKIGNNCSIVGDIQIGANTVISDNVVIKNRVSIGKNCIIQACSVIGEDGFGFFEQRGKKIMISHHGGVVIGDDVFVGTHVNIARGTIDDTVIEGEVKIAPSSHIGHNNHIEKDVVFICSQSYGSVHIKENAYIAGSIIRDQCVIGENSLIGMGSVVTKNIEKDKIAIGIPAKVVDERKRG